MNEFMNIAIKEAKVGIRSKHGGPFGAVVVKNGKVISKAHNVVLKKKDSTCHAEIEAIRKACKVLNTYDLSKCEMYTTGKPCPMCKNAIQWSKISKVYYGCTYADAREIGFNEKDGNSSSYKEIQIEKLLCKELYLEFVSRKGKIY